MRLIDFNGMEFTEASEKYISKLLSDINKRQYKIINKIEEQEAKLTNVNLSNKKIESIKREISNLNAEKSALEDVRNEISVLSNSSQVYNIKRDNSLNIRGDILGNGAEVRSGTMYNQVTDMLEILLGDESLGLLAHELKHAFQFETGAFSSGNNKEGCPFYDKTDEIEAYTRGALFGQSFYGRLPSIYNDLQSGPQSVEITFSPETINNPVALKGIANTFKSVFRWKGVTYKPKSK